MKKIVYINPKNLNGINTVSKYANSDTFLKHLDEIDYHFILFSTLYQSGADFFETEISFLPEAVKKNNFWRTKFVNIDDAIYKKSIIKSAAVLENNFDIELDKKYLSPQYTNILYYFSDLFYSAETGTPFVKTDYTETTSFDFLESRFRREFFISLQNLLSLFQAEKVSTIVPLYTVLKKDVDRFSDIANSGLYSKYSESVGLLTEDTSSFFNIKKDIHVNAIKLLNKHSNDLDIKSMSFKFLKFNKTIVDLFTNKTLSIIGDHFIDTIEQYSKVKKSVFFYSLNEANYMILWANRIGELMMKAGNGGIKEFLDHNKNK